MGQTGASTSAIFKQDVAAATGESILQEDKC